MELALYVASRAMESFALCMLQFGYLPARLVSRAHSAGLCASICPCVSQELELHMSRRLVMSLESFAMHKRLCSKHSSAGRCRHDQT